MKLTLTPTPNLREPEIEIRYSEFTNEIEALLRHIRSREICVVGEKDGRRHMLPAMQIYYIESVDKQVFRVMLSRVFRFFPKSVDIFPDLKHQDLGS